MDVVGSEQFGQGAVFIGQAAVDAGLADEVSTFDEVMAELVEDEASTGLLVA
ncbi:Peptidase family S49 [Methylobacterium sp. UNC378MF]|nr:Peptidase family S49 [Methylobacterium sp. UNC378MF]